jgi:hypothetical protein
MAQGAPLAVNVSLPSDGLQGRSRLEKLMHKWLDGDDEAGRRLKCVRVVAMHSLAQLAVRGQTDKRDRLPVRCPRTRRRGERCLVLIPGFLALASPGAAHRGIGRAAGGGGEARGGRSLLGDVGGMWRPPEEHGEVLICDCSAPEIPRY